MRISELSAKSGVPASTIRFWERVRVLPRSARISGQRRYDSEAVHRLALLRLAQTCGFRLDEMRHLLNGFPSTVPPSHRWTELAKNKKVELEAQMSRLRAMSNVLDRLLLCQCADLSDCGRRAESVMQFVS